MPRLLHRVWLTAMVIASSAVCAATPSTAEHFTVTPHQADQVRLVAYGDQRFTATSEREASRPAARQALVARIAEERPDAVLMTGDQPWRGGTVADYAVYTAETDVWRRTQIPVYPALGNHEFAGCVESECLAHWWAANPQVQGRRWYALDVGPLVRAYALDSMQSFNSGSAERQWLEQELNSLPDSVRFVVLYLHHPPVAAHETDILRHNVRPNEVVLADFLTERAKTLPARILVVAGHIHNYERREQGGVVYLVSGGGGAKPYPVSRDGDLFPGRDEPNFHYLMLTATRDRLHVDMHRLEDPDDAHPGHFLVRDTFDLSARTTR